MNPGDKHFWVLQMLMQHILSSLWPTLDVWIRNKCTSWNKSNQNFNTASRPENTAIKIHKAIINKTKKVDIKYNYIQ